jgi:7-cyano-7-deazaguanine tRNA-ribosyltransferase
MSFEILDRDLLGRIGRFKTKRGIVETPLFLPVVNPVMQFISPEEMKEDFGCQAIITNAYLLKKNFEEEVKKNGVHDFLKFDGTVVTDSGAYQNLVYGQIDTTAGEIAKFEEEIDTDVAVILDVPTGWNARRDRAEYTVEETLRRARLTLNSLTRNDLLWIGPVQGGNYLDLVAHSAIETGKMPFHIYALGSPTQVMERYLFALLVDMVMTAKKNLPVEKPLHLFGAGHPFMLSLAVAMGCDLFDSAAYAIYARAGKYMTDYGTIKLKDLKYFPCSCRVCSRFTPTELRAMPPKEMMKLLAWHNLESCFTEIRRVKQAIREKRLWELLELRARSHPNLLSALKNLGKYQEYIETYAPTSKSKGFFYFDSTGLARPEVIRHRKRLRKWIPPTEGEVLFLLPQLSSKPFHRSKEYKRIRRLISKEIGEDINKVDFCFYAAPFGVTPVELDEVYPLSQFELSLPLDSETVDYVVKQVEYYIARRRGRYRAVVLYPSQVLGERIVEACKRTCEEAGMRFLTFKSEEDFWVKKAMEDLVDKLSKS